MGSPIGWFAPVLEFLHFVAFLALPLTVVEGHIYATGHDFLKTGLHGSFFQVHVCLIPSYGSYPWLKDTIVLYQ